ncbi:hypothetical protein Tcan_02426 [Toxocara canis]|uniref:Uncharacterized protein n=1 Tax=Toxocara canis TaxID=6265 RepID=A0A0B2UP81_TOXCA|nr:hypothetical protein Tcan_02426 [Toxocara canis]
MQSNHQTASGNRRDDIAGSRGMRMACRGESWGRRPLEYRMGLAVVEGVAVPEALAASFADPKKRPFSYTRPLPPSADPTIRSRTSRSRFPKVLPILPPEEQPQQQPQPSNMPSNIQYNTPMPIYSR